MTENTDDSVKKHYLNLAKSPDITRFLKTDQLRPGKIVTVSFYADPNTHLEHPNMYLQYLGENVKAQKSGSRYVNFLIAGGGRKF